MFGLYVVWAYDVYGIQGTFYLEILEKSIEWSLYM